MMSSHVLIVDSDGASGERLARILSGMGYRFGLATSGSTALQIVQNTNVSLVVVAEHLEDCDGLDCFARLRRAKRSLVGLLMSDRADLGAVVSAMTYGVERVLTRPVDPAELVEAISEVAASRQLLPTGT